MQISQASLQGGRVRVQPSASLQQGGAAIRSCGTWNCFLFIWMSDPGRCGGASSPSHESWRPRRREAEKETCARGKRRGEEGIINAISPRQPRRMDSEFRITAFWPTMAPSHPLSPIWKHFGNRRTWLPSESPTGPIYAASDSWANRASARCNYFQCSVSWFFHPRIFSLLPRWF